MNICHLLCAVCSRQPPLHIFSVPSHKQSGQNFIPKVRLCHRGVYPFVDRPATDVSTANQIKNPHPARCDSAGCPWNQSLLLLRVRSSSGCILQPLGPGFSFLSFLLPLPPTTAIFLLLLVKLGGGGFCCSTRQKTKAIFSRLAISVFN